MCPRVHTKMHRFAWFWLLLAGLYVCIAEYFRQERAVIAYYNPKYVQNAQAFTGRLRRGEPYTTNITAHFIKPWNNNVTIEISYRAKGTPMPLVISAKYCDMLKTKWVTDFLKSYSDGKIVCPLQPGRVSLVNIELPPKNFPMPIPKGVVHFNLTYYITRTKEMIMRTTLVLHATT